jgi:hypothetical protein
VRKSKALASVRIVGSIPAPVLALGGAVLASGNPVAFGVGWAIACTFESSLVFTVFTRRVTRAGPIAFAAVLEGRLPDGRTSAGAEELRMEKT